MRKGSSLPEPVCTARSDASAFNQPPFAMLTTTLLDSCLLGSPRTRTGQRTAYPSSHAGACGGSGLTAFTIGCAHATLVMERTIIDIDTRNRIIAISPNRIHRRERRARREYSC